MVGGARVAVCLHGWVWSGEELLSAQFQVNTALPLLGFGDLLTPYGRVPASSSVILQPVAVCCLWENFISYPGSTSVRVTFPFPEKSQYVFTPRRLT